MDDINNFAIRQHAAVSQMQLTRESARQWGREVALAIEAARKRQQEWDGSEERWKLCMRGSLPEQSGWYEVRFELNESFVAQMLEFDADWQLWKTGKPPPYTHYVLPITAQWRDVRVSSTSDSRSVPALEDSRCRYAEVKQCDECTDCARCSRIGQCLRYRCAFGEVDKP